MDIKTEVEIIEKLGDEIGYGHLMEIASALWRKKLKVGGYPVSGAFVPTILSFIKKEHREDTEKSLKCYDEIISKTNN